MSNLFPRTSAGVKAETTALTVRAPGLPPALAASDLMTPAERGELRTLERTVERGIETFLDVGRALLEIRDRRLYREEFTSFEAYCRERWHKSSRWARYHIEAAEVVNNLLGPGAKAEGRGSKAEQAESVPVTESQARPMARLPKEQQREAWDQARTAAGKQPVTARHVEEAVERIAPRATKGRNGRNGSEQEQEQEQEFQLGLQAPSYASPAMRSILGQAGDIVQRMGALDQMLSEAHDATCLNLLRPAREKLDKIVAIYVEGREAERPKAKVQSPTPSRDGLRRGGAQSKVRAAKAANRAEQRGLLGRDYLVRRELPPGVFRYQTPKMGWTNDPGNAKRYGSESAAWLEAMDSDNVVRFDVALKKAWQKKHGAA